MTDKSPFQRSIDDLNDGCGCACHLGVGYHTQCDHCAPYRENITGRYRTVVCYSKNRENPGWPPEPIYAYIEAEGYEEPPIPGTLAEIIIRREYSNWIRPLAQVVAEASEAGSSE